MPAAGFQQRPAAHYVAAALAVANGNMGITRAAREHGVNRKTLATRLTALIEGGAVSTPELSRLSIDSLRVASESLPELLARLALGAVQCLQTLPLRPDERGKLQMAQAEQAFKTLDRLGMMPAKPKDEPTRPDPGRFIDLIEQPVEQPVGQEPEPNNAQLMHSDQAAAV